VLETDRVAESVGLPPSAVVTGHHQPQYASVGLPFLCVEISDLDSLARAVPNTSLFRSAQVALPDPGLEFNIYAYVVAEADPFTVRARMFAPLDGVPEDPATGSAAGALGAFLTHLRPESDLDLRFPIHQGIEMGRPSQIDLAVSKRQGTIERVEISGRCVDVMRGTLEL
jgi:trans-2,3-dihydro-3-hydroxyanthranilate isomerase